MAITDFNVKTSKSDGILALNIQVGSVLRTTMFIVVPSRANFNLLLGRDWIHAVDAVLSTVNQKMFLWDNLGNAVEIEADDTVLTAPEVSILNNEKLWEYVGSNKIRKAEDLKKESTMMVAVKPNVGVNDWIFI